MKKSMILFTLATVLLLLAAAVPLHAQTTFTVTNLDDDGAGSLRDAITEANGATEEYIIDFDDGLTGSIVLGSSLPAITSADGLTINGDNRITVSGNNAVRPFSVNSGTSLSLENLTVSDGSASNGGGIYNSGTVTLTNSTLSGNGVVINGGGLGFGFGGGIFNDGGTLTLTNSTLSGNNVFNDSGTRPGIGGGIFNDGGTLTLTNSTLSDNSASSNISGEGGGIYNFDGTLTLINSTLSGNSAIDGIGGGIYNSGTGTVTLTNSTLSGNSGGIYNGGTLTLTNSLIANSTSGGDCVNYNIFNDGGHNLVEDGSCITVWSNGNRSGNPLFVDPSNPAGPDGMFGTPDDGLRLTDTSPAINAGDPETNLSLFPGGPDNPIDLAGNPRVFNGAPIEDIIDMGAYEFQGEPFIISPTNGILYVNISVDGTGSNFIGDGSSWENALPELPDALKWAREQHDAGNGWHGVNDSLQVWVATGTYKPLYNAADGQYTQDGNRDNAFVMVKNVQLYGGFPDSGNPTVTDRDWENNPTVLSGDLDGNEQLSGGDAYHVLIAANDVGNAFIDGFTVTGGNANGSGIITVNGQNITSSNGGGIFNDGDTLTLANSTLSGNSGGGIFNNSSTVTLTNTTLSGNSGGGIFNNSGTVTLTNTTLSGNSASGIRNEGSGIVTVTNSTLSGNSAIDGGGIYNTGTVTLTNSLIANSPSGGDCVNSGIINDNGHNLVEDGSCITVGSNGNLNGDPLFTDPENGDYTLTAASPAINAGSNQLYTDAGGNLVNDFDLAGNPRVFDGTPDPDIVDMGAYEFQGEPFSISPDVDVLKTVTDVNGGSIRPGDTLEYTITVTNRDVEDGDKTINLSLTDIMPDNAIYVAESTELLTTPPTGWPTGPLTDASGDDIAEFSGGELRVNLGGGADANTPGFLDIGESTSLSFRVVVDANAAGEQIQNQASVTFEGETLGDESITASSHPPETTGPTTVDVDNAIIPSDDNVLYVDQNVSGGNGSGNSWTNALPELADALKWAREKHAADNNWLQNDSLQIWVAQGIYKPLYNASVGNYYQDGGRDNAFVMVKNVQLYGGFPDNGNPTVTDRDWENNPTVLSGDLGADGDNSDNAYHVMISSGDVGNALLDGFTVTGGNANGGSNHITVNEESIQRNIGGGIFKHFSSLSLINVEISGNTANGGGGIYNSGTGTFFLINVEISGNTAADSGGGIYNNGTINLANVEVAGNTASNGGGIINSGTIELTNVEVSGNTASSVGGGIFNDGPLELANVTLANNNAGTNEFDGIYNYLSFSVNIANSIVWNTISGAPYTAQNSVIMGSNDIADGNIDATGLTADDIFTDPANGDYTLKTTSPAINAGDPETNLSMFPGGPDNPTDLAGNPRVFDGAPIEDIIDMGAYEFQGEPVTAPGQVVLNTPHDEAVNVALSPEFSWQSVDGADEYHLQVSENDEFSSTVIDESGLTDTTFDPASDLYNSTMYYWRVRGVNSGGEGEWSEIFSFTTLDQPEASDTRILLANNQSYTFTPADFGQDDHSFVVVIEDLPGGFNGDLELDGSDVETGDEISVGDIDAGELSYTPPANVYGYGYDSFDFRIKDNLGNESEDSYTMSLDVAATSVELDYDGEGWRFLANPSDGDTYGDFLAPIWTKGIPGSDSPGALVPNIYTLDQPNYQWQAPGDMSNTVTRGQAFLVYVYSEDDNNGSDDGFPKTLTSGENWQPLTSEFSWSTLDYDPDQGPEGDSHFLIANPHPVSLDFCGFTFTNVANSIDIWDPSANGGNGDYENLNCGVGDVFIAPFQGFWVRTTDTNPVLEIPEAAYLESAEEGYFKQPDDERSAMSQKDIADLGQNREDLTGLPNLSGLAFTVQSEDNIFTNTARILFSEEGTPGLDAGDAPKLSPAGLAGRWLSFYSLDEQDKAYALQNLPTDFGEKIHIPLDIQTTEAGSYTMEWSLPESHVFNGSYFLRDNQSGEVIELREGSSYRFEINPGQTSKVLKTLEVSKQAGVTHRMNSGAEPRFELLVATAGVDGMTELGAVPEEFTLAQNYPNPFNPSTVISYQLSAVSEVRLEVYDMLGRRVAELVNGQIAAGRHTVNFDASGLSSGIYLYRLQAGSSIMTKKLTVVK